MLVSQIPFAQKSALEYLVQQKLWDCTEASTRTKTLGEHMNRTVGVSSEDLMTLSIDMLLET